MFARHLARGLAVISLVGSTGLGTLLAPAPVAAADPAPVTCDLWAAVSGNDAAAGGQATPLRSVGALISRLQAGQTGCLRAGDEFNELLTVNASNGAPGQPVTVTSEPGGTARFTGQIHFAAASHDIVMSRITFLGNAYAKSTHLNVDGDRIELRGNDISHPRGICVDVGAIEAYQQVYSGSVAEDFVLASNRIHHCGTDAGLTWSADDSGAHGVYIINSTGARVVENLIHDNQWRGLQTWPKAEGTLIANNVFDGNATNVNIGSALLEGYPWMSINTTVRDNIITNATLWRPDKNPAQVHGNFPNNGQTHGNVVTGNCLFHADPSKNFSGAGYSAVANIVADPRFRDVANNDFTLSDGSPCLGKGPAAIQPAGDVTPPETTISGGPSGFVRATTATFTLTAGESGATFQCRVDGAAFGACVSPFTTSALGNGAHTFDARAVDAAGNVDASPATRTWTVDTTAPLAAGPVQSLVGPQVGKAADGTARISVKLTWSATDVGSGISAYELQQTTDRGVTWQAVSVAAGSTTTTRALAVGYTYGYRVRATDRAGNVGAWATGPRFLVAAYQNDHAAVRYTGSGAWTTHANAAFLGGTARHASTAGNRATITLSNVRNVALVSYLYATRGQARVIVDGVLVSTINLYSATQNVPQAVVSPLAWATPGQHSVTIEVVGTAGHPRVDIDAFLALHDQP